MSIAFSVLDLVHECQWVHESMSVSDSMSLWVSVSPWVHASMRVSEFISVSESMCQWVHESVSPWVHVSVTVTSRSWDFDASIKLQFSTPWSWAIYWKNSPSVRPSVRPFFQISGTVHRIFLISHTKLGHDKARKVTEPDFSKKIWFSRNLGKRAQIGPKSDLFGFFWKSAH